MPSAVANLSGSGPEQVYLNLLYISYDLYGNYSTWYYELVFKKNGGPSWIADATNWWEIAGFAASGRVYFGIPSSWAGSGDHVLASGYFTKAHDANGYLIVNDNMYGTISSPHGGIGAGTAVINSGITAPRIPKKPGKMIVAGYGWDQITANSARFRFQAPADDGGSPWASFAFRYATQPDFSDAVMVGSSGTTVLNNLLPGTTYYAQARGQTQAGYVTDWSDTAVMTTLAGIYVGDGTSWKPQPLRVGNGNAWTTPAPTIGDGDSWEAPVNV